MITTDIDNFISIYQSSNCNENPNIIFTFPTSNGQRTDIMTFNVLEAILNDNIIVVMIQTQDEICFYNPSISDDMKMKNLDQFLQIVDLIFDQILYQYHTTKIPILLGCSMGGYYAQMCFLRYPNRFHCISLGGMCDISILDKHSFQGSSDDHVINYYDYRQYWDRYNPIAYPVKKNLHTLIIACFGLKQDGFLMEQVYTFHDRLQTWNYIKTYNLGHNFESWQEMVTDIFKGSSPDFHDFRIEFYMGELRSPIAPSFVSW